MSGYVKQECEAPSREALGDEAMVETDMTLERLSELVEAYGASALRWPTAERARAETLLAQSVEARALVAKAAELDRLLDMAPYEAPSADLVARIMAARPRAAGGQVVSIGAARRSPWRAMAQVVWPYGSPAFPAGALAASIVLGIGLGVAAPSTLSTFGLATNTTATVSSSAATGSGEQLVSLALAENDYPEEWKR